MAQNEKFCFKNHLCRIYNLTAFFFFFLKRCLLSAWGGLFAHQEIAELTLRKLMVAQRCWSSSRLIGPFVLLSRNEPLYRTAPTLNSAGVLHHPPLTPSTTANTTTPPPPGHASHCDCLRKKLPVARSDAGRHMRSDGRTDRNSRRAPPSCSSILRFLRRCSSNRCSSASAIRAVRLRGRRRCVRLDGRSSLSLGPANQ